MSAILPNCDFEGDVHKKIKKFVVHFYAVESSVWNAHIDSISLVPRFPADRNLWAVPRNLSMVFSPLYRGARGCCSWIVFHRAFKPRSRTVINCLYACLFPRALCRNLRDPGTKKCAYVLNPDRARQKRARKARCRGSARRLLGDEICRRNVTILERSP